jgi:hypothetical protein
MQSESHYINVAARLHYSSKWTQPFGCERRSEWTRCGLIGMNLIDI